MVCGTSVTVVTATRSGASGNSAACVLTYMLCPATMLLALNLGENGSFDRLLSCADTWNNVSSPKPNDQAPSGVAPANKGPADSVIKISSIGSASDRKIEGPRTIVRLAVFV